jgi:hypothetical protein
MPGSCVACTPGARVMRGVGVARAARVEDGVVFGSGVLRASCVAAGGWSGAASFFGCAMTYAPDPTKVANATSTALARKSCEFNG